MHNLSAYEISNILDKSENCLIITHINPDGDCLGSAFALMEMQKAEGKKAAVACDSPVPARLRFMDGGVIGFEEAKAGNYDLIVSVDAASPNQLGRFEEMIPSISLMIDHHRHGSPYAPGRIVPDACAAGEIIYDIYIEKRLRGKVGVNAKVLRYIYAAIASDSGSLVLPNVTPHTLEVAAELVAGINAAKDGGLTASDIARLLFSTVSEKDLSANKIISKNLILSEGGRLAVTYATAEELEAAGLEESDLGNAVDFARTLEGVLVGISLKPAGENRYKLSSRANAEIDCASVCASFGGGGHTRAAGCTIEASSMEEAVRIATEKFGKLVSDYVNNNEILPERI